MSDATVNAPLAWEARARERLNALVRKLVGFGVPLADASQWSIALGRNSRNVNKNTYVYSHPVIGAFKGLTGAKLAHQAAWTAAAQPP